MTTLISIEDVRHPYLRTLRHGDALRLDLLASELVCIVGASGSGKTSLMKILLGLLTPCEGSVNHGCAGEEVRLGVAFQSANFMPWRRMVDNVRAPLPTSVRVMDQRHKALAALNRAALPNAGLLFPDQLSGGMRARAALARALVNDPSVLVLDEPFAALDAALAEDLNDLIADLAGQQGLSVFMVTQDLGRTLVRADKVLVLGHGKLGSNPLVDLNSVLGPRNAGRSAEAVACLRTAIIDTMRNPAGGMMP